jgi:hypothetical protein
VILTRWLGNADAYDDVAEKWRVRQCDAKPREVLARMKGELVDTNLETVAGEQRTVRPTIGVGHRRREQPSSSDYEEVQFDADARRGCPARGVEHMSGQARHRYRLRLNPKQPYGGRASV